MPLLAMTPDTFSDYRNASVTIKTNYFTCTFIKEVFTAAIIITVLPSSTASSLNSC
jgi:hypothetical protein